MRGHRALTEAEPLCKSPMRRNRKHDAKPPTLENEVRLRRSHAESWLYVVMLAIFCKPYRAVGPTQVMLFATCMVIAFHHNRLYEQVGLLPARGKKTLNQVDIVFVKRNLEANNVSAIVDERLTSEEIVDQTICSPFDLPWRSNRETPRLASHANSGFVSIDRQLFESSLATGQSTWLPSQCPISFTLATQTTPERLWMLRWICQRWDGPIVVAVYTDHETMITKDASCGDRVDYKVISAPKDVFVKHNLYPVNRLRNVAIACVRTSHFLLADIDLWPDTHLLARLRALARSKPGFFQDPKRAIVIPAFARDVKTICTSSTAANDTHSERRMVECEREGEQMPDTYEQLLRCIIERKCHIFDRYNHNGHGTTDYRAWLKQGNDTFRNIPCFLSNRYEPYIVAAHHPLRPSFEENFTGYGKNKIQNLVHLRYAGWKFTVLAQSFLIHFPHHKSAARIQWESKGSRDHEGGPSSTDGVKSDLEIRHRTHMDRLYRKFLDALIRVYGNPSERSNATRICASD